MRTRIALTTTMTVIATSMVVSSFIAGAGAGPTRSPGPAGGWVTTSDRVPSGTAVPGALGEIPEGGFQDTAGLAHDTSGAPQGGSAGRSLSAELSMANALHRVTATLTPPPASATSSTAGSAAQTATALSTTTTSTTTTTTAPPTDATSTATADWACIRIHESGDRYNSPAAPSGAYGVLHSTWISMGMGGWPYQAPPSAQDAIALELYHRYGWTPWSTRFVCGLG